MSANLVVLIVPTGARRWHVSTFPPLARSPAQSPAAGIWPIVAYFPAAGK